MAPPICLLGPPELRLTHPTPTHEENPHLGKYQSSSSTPTLNPCLEFFFKSITTSSDPKRPQNPAPKYGYTFERQKDLTECEEEAWNQDPLTTLGLIFCLRMVGRPNKEAFYTSFSWVHKNHPLALALNLNVFGDLGWFKDLLEILSRVLQDSIVKKREEEKRMKSCWKQVLIPLRKALSLECSLAAKQNKKSLSLFKNRKALIALEDYRNIAGCHDGGGNNESKLKFKSRMNIVQKLVPKKAIIDTCFGDEVKLPHHVLASLEKEHGGVTETVEVQWWRLVKELSSKGKLRNCVAVCDVPESMRGTLKEKVCISMGLLISDRSKKPWKGSVLSFSKVPMLKRIEGENLQSKCEFMRS